MKYLASFNDEQKGIFIKNDPLKPNTLVIAGAGSGKTRSLIGLLEKAILIDKINPEQIIVSTYTTKAADEIKLRLEESLSIISKLKLGTIHSIARKILIDTLKLQITIISEDDTLVIFGILCQDKSLLYKLPKLYSEHKEVLRNLSLKELLIIRDISVDKVDIISKYFTKYEEIKRMKGCFDFTDLMVNSLRILQTNKSADKYLQKIKLIIVDEVQDINDFQYELFMTLNKYANNMIMFGDDYQSIYGFRGSNSLLMKKFKEVKNVETKFLKSNYRSSNHIVKFCNKIIEAGGEHTSMLITKECQSVVNYKSSRNDINVKYFLNEHEQAQYILKILQETTEDKKIGVLSRTNKELKTFSIFLKTQSIPHLCQQNKKVQDTLKIALEGICVLNNNPLQCYYWWYIVITYKALSDKDLRKSLVLGEKSLWELILTDEMPQNDKNDVEFVNDMKELYKDPTYINHILLKFDSETESSSSEDACSTELSKNIVLQTIHSSKGLEYDYVIILDCKPRPTDSYEEAIRLFYVACSRAKSKLLITHIGNSIPFIENIPKTFYL